MDEVANLIEGIDSGYRLARETDIKAWELWATEGSTDMHHARMRNAEYYEGKAQGILCALVSLDLVTVEG